MTMTLRISTVVASCAVVISCLPYDINEVGLGVLAAIVCARIAEQINSRIGRVCLFSVTSVAAVQLFVLARKAVCEEGMYSTLSQHPVKKIFGDIAYGFKHVILTVIQSVSATVNYFNEEACMPEIEGLNPRLFVVGWLIIGMSLLLLLKPVYDKRKKKPLII